MNYFDFTILHWFNRYAGRWPRLDSFVWNLSGMNMLKGIGIVCLLWWAWFSGRPLAREKVTCSIIASLVALVAARVVASILPWRPRPLQEPGFHAPAFVDVRDYLGWSSFPSDHASMYVALALGVWFVSRRAGLLAMGWAVFVVLLPRIYLGAHHPTDLIAGAVLGVACCAPSVKWPELRERIAGPIVRAAEASPGMFYPAFFIVSYGLTEQFWSFRTLVGALLHRSLEGR